MTRTSNASTGVLIAGAVAGPLLLAILGLATLYLQLPTAIEVRPGDIAALLPIGLMASVFGAIVALPANGLASLLMIELGKRLRWTRNPLAWIMAGAVLGGLASRIFAAMDGMAPIAFAFIVSAAICARICRHFVHWDDEMPA